MLNTYDMRSTLRWISYVFIAFSTIQAHAQNNYWSDEGNYDSSWYKENAKTYKLNTPEEFAGLYYLMNKGITFEGKIIELNENLNFGKYLWKPLPIFKGTLNGTNHIIKNLKIKDYIRIPGIANGYRYGIFSEIENSTIQNLTLDESCNINIDIDNPNSDINIGFIAAYAYGENHIMNCYNFGRLQVTSSYTTTFSWGDIYMGAILGYACGHGYENSVEISNSCNSGDIDIKGKLNVTAGGIIGWANCVKFTDVVNEGDIFSTTEDNGISIGGVCGLAQNLVYFTKCKNTGNINCTAAKDYSNATDIYIGGISCHGGDIKDCHNKGNIYIENHGTIRVAGITNTGIVNLSSNKGNIIAKSEFKSYAAGIIGEMSTSLAFNSNNEGYIFSSGWHNSYAAGIGISSRAIVNCYNTGNVKAEEISGAEAYLERICLAGGIASEASEIYNCYNSAEITSNVKHRNTAAPIIEMAAPIIAYTGQANEKQVEYTYYNLTFTNEKNDFGMGLTSEQMQGINFDFLQILNKNASTYNGFNWPIQKWCYKENVLYPTFDDETITSIPKSSNPSPNIYNINGLLCIKSESTQKISVYNINGQLINILNIIPGIHYFNLPNGMYIINQQKVIIRK